MRRLTHLACLVAVLLFAACLCAGCEKRIREAKTPGAAEAGHLS